VKDDRCLAALAASGPESGEIAGARNSSERVQADLVAVTP
jgi:hypothetical protein